MHSIQLFIIFLLILAILHSRRRSLWACALVYLKEYLDNACETKIKYLKSETERVAKQEEELLIKTGSFAHWIERKCKVSRNTFDKRKLISLESQV
jgi:hypothetical protein